MMKRFLILLTLLLAMMFSCSQLSENNNSINNIDNGEIITTGKIVGKATYTNTSNHAGIQVTLVSSDGIVAYDSQISSRSRSAVAVMKNVVTSESGEYSFDNVKEGVYTIYASSDDSTEKAVLTNVVVQANQIVTATDLNLTATGSISGRIIIDGNENENLGITVVIAGTSYMAVTDSFGFFTISDIPAGSGYQIVIMKGDYCTIWKKVSVEAGKENNLGDKNISSQKVPTDTPSNTDSFIWQGSFAVPPANPEKYWAYFNTTDGCSYIYDGAQWTLLAQAGKDGKDGADGKDGIDGINGINGTNGNSIEWQGSFYYAPENPELYWAYFNITDGCSYIYDGTWWTLLVQAGADGIDGEDGKDGTDGIDGIDGVTINWRGSFATSPAYPEKYWAYFDTDDGCSYIYDGTQWTLLAQAGADGIDGEDGKDGTDGIDGIDGVTINWKGSFATSPAYPELYWAYFNTDDGCSYIYDGTQWTLLAQAGEKGEQGIQGETGSSGLNGVDGNSINWKGSFEVAPTNPKLYWAYFNTLDGCSYIYDGAQWTLLAQAGGKGDTGDAGKDGNSLIWKGASEIPPATPELYWAYFNTLDGCSYIYDGTRWTLLASAATEVIWKGSLDSAPANPEVNWAYYDTTFCKSYIYDGTDWKALPEAVNPNKTFIWKGSLAVAPENPEHYWAYYNMTDKNSYIYIENAWEILASPGESGLNGETAQVVTVDNFANYLSAQEGAGPFIIKLSGELLAGRLPEIKAALNTDKAKIVSLDLSEVTGLTNIPNDAFDCVTNLQAIALPNTVTVIGEEAFYSCSKLKTVKLQNNLTTIGNSAFKSCYVLENINIPETVTNIKDYAFHGCYTITNIQLPQGLLLIGNSAFIGCRGLTSIIIPGSVISIGNYAFGGASNSCTSLSQVIINDGVKIIGNYAFYGCTSISSIEIPDSVTSMGTYVFYNCTNLSSVKFPNISTALNAGMFSGCSSLSSITIPSNVTNIGESALYGCTSLTKLVIPDTVTSIGASAFQNCTGLTNVTLSKNISTLQGFRGCTSLTSISIPDSVVTIGSSAFYGCSSLTAVSIPDSVTNIDSSAFYECSNLSQVEFGENVTSLGYSVFYGCKGLTSITLPEKLAVIPSDAFSNCTGLADVTIGENVTEIGSSAFRSCTSLTFIEIPDSVKTIGEGAFASSGLQSISLGSGITTLVSSGSNYGVFNNCKSLKSIVIPEKVTSIPIATFSGCSSLTTVVLHDKITSIGSGSFRSCTALSSIVIPGSVTSMSSYVFEYCSALTNIYVKKYTVQPTGWDTRWLSGCTTATVKWNYVE